MAKAEAIYVAIETGWTTLPGEAQEFFFRKNQRFRGDHPVVRACPLFFRPWDPSEGVIDHDERPA